MDASISGDKWDMWHDCINRNDIIEVRGTIHVECVDFICQSILFANKVYNLVY